MKKIFIGTDIILDLLAKRKSFYLPAANLFTLADRGKLHINVSSLTFATIFYLLSKDNGQERAKKILFKFKSLVTVLPVDNKIIELALSSEFKDFKYADIPVMTAESFLKVT
jgi:hypothetical protein